MELTGVVTASVLGMIVDDAMGTPDVYASIASTAFDIVLTGIISQDKIRIASGARNIRCLAAT